VYAIIRDGGRQHKVAEGDHIAIDRLGLDAGEEIEFPDVLLLSDDEKVSVGTPTVEGAKVLGEILGATSDRKLYAVQYRRRKNSRRRVGHRQKYTEVLIKRIVAPT